mmetsp:Transcript_45029/g.118992  ORF Transcript_45029/g.118992 Transcript_45029/m.118992 type:complete len:261 (+) Transcript_45029:769-1551(+)
MASAANKHRCNTRPAFLASSQLPLLTPAPRKNATVGSDADRKIGPSRDDMGMLKTHNQCGRLHGGQRLGTLIEPKLAMRIASKAENLPAHRHQRVLIAACDGALREIGYQQIQQHWTNADAARKLAEISDTKTAAAAKSPGKNATASRSKAVMNTTSHSDHTGKVQSDWGADELLFGLAPAQLPSLGGTPQVQRVVCPSHVNNGVRITASHASCGRRQGYSCGDIKMATPSSSSNLATAIIAPCVDGPVTGDHRAMRRSS